MRASGRRGVSELYASMLMIGITISLGGVVAVTAVNQLDLSTNSASIAAAVQGASAGKQVSLLYGTVPMPGSGGCSVAYRGYKEGTGYTVAFYNYGSVPFTPAEVFANGTLLSGGVYNTIPPAGRAVYALTLQACAHPSGQTFLMVDASGDEVQVGT